MRTRIVFTGDISFSKFFENAWQRDDLLSPEIKQYLRDSECTVANVECPLTDRKIDSTRVLNHACPPEAGAFLKGLGVHCWSLANNHITDCGAGGLLDTLRCAKENGCKTIGVGANAEEASRPVLIGGDVKIGVISLAKPWTYLKAGSNTPGALTWEHTDLIKRSINMLRKKGADWVVIIAHGGDEYADIALPLMRKQYHALLDLGADIIVAHHPHVVQNYELPEKNKAIFYSLGNFIFDTENQRAFRNTDTGVLLGINFEKESFSFDHLPVHIDRNGNRVVKGETPAIFCEISDDDYKRIWPFAARCFYSVDLRNRKKLHKKMEGYSPAVMLAHEIFVCRHKRERTIQYGRFLSYLGKWKNAGCKDVIRYIKGEQK